MADSKDDTKDPKAPGADPKAPEKASDDKAPAKTKEPKTATAKYVLIHGRVNVGGKEYGPASKREPISLPGLSDDEAAPLLAARVARLASDDSDD